MSKKEKKGFAKEFKEFISRGSIVDMAVGVVVGGAFTTIVNTLVKSVLTPLVNWIVYLICGGDTEAFSGLDVVLIPATVNPETGAVEKAATVLGFSDLITAIINFFLIALSLAYLVYTLIIYLKLRHKEKKEREENEVIDV